jgi:hypothetical protein
VLSGEDRCADKTTGVAYDAAQNRSQVVVTAGGTPTTTNYTADALDFYTSVGSTTHVRDPNGNLRDDGTNLYDTTAGTSSCASAGSRTWP